VQAKLSPSLTESQPFFFHPRLPLHFRELSPTYIGIDKLSIVCINFHGHPLFRLNFILEKAGNRDRPFSIDSSHLVVNPTFRADIWLGLHHPCCGPALNTRNSFPASLTSGQEIEK
jgi:hypothetical protein